MRLSEPERSVCEAIAAGRDELVELASALITFDTTARGVGEPPRQEAALQEYLAGWICAAGAAVDLFEPTLRRWRARRWCSRPGLRRAP